MIRGSIGSRILGPPPLNRPGAGPMTTTMATNGTWLCPTSLHRARLLDLEAKLGCRARSCTASLGDRVA